MEAVQAKVNVLSFGILKSNLRMNMLGILIAFLASLPFRDCGISNQMTWSCVIMRAGLLL